MLDQGHFEARDYTNIPGLLEGFQIHKFVLDGYIIENRTVLFEESITGLGVFILRHGILEIGLLEFIKRNDDAKDLCERFLEISLGARACKGDFLSQSQPYS